MPPTSKLTVSAILPLPDALQVDPDEAAQVHVAPVSEAGMVSATVALTAVEGPAFDTTMVYVTLVPGTKTVVPSVLVIDRSARGVSELLSVDVLFEFTGSDVPSGGVIVAVLLSVPRAVARIVAVSV